MYFDFSQIDGGRAYKLLACTIVPRPIAWVVTQDANGKTNAAPFSFFNAFSGAPPIVCLGLGHRNGGPKDTLNNIRHSGEFVVNLVSEDTLDAMNTTAIPFPPHVDEIATAGLTTEASVQVGPPRIAQSPVAFECRMKQIIELDGPNVLVIAQVAAAHIRDASVTSRERCYIDTPSLKLVGRMESPGWYLKTSDRFLLRQIPLELWDNALATD
jgi:flavin reductase (DIM6/NTAB) family NADH-FMN oxidoreductase RutF